MDIGQTQISHILHYLGQGYGRVWTCAKVGVHYRTFLRQLREDPIFSGQIREIEANRMESCEMTLYRMATRNFDSPMVLRAAIAYLGRRDKIAESARSRREKAAKASAK